MAEKTYDEELSSTKTSLLFLGLMTVFLVIFVWRLSADGFHTLPVICLCVAALFGFYILNYRILKITITENDLLLKFGLVGWKTPMRNVAACNLDDSPGLIKYGGAGVHFAFVKGKYRAFFNFLEYSRVLVTFHQRQGLVRELVFSTRNPEQVLKFIQERINT
jgi:hypothetical protein